MQTSTASTSFGQLLKDWRRLRGRSQLDLALEADVSARHVSFMENGRSRPSRAMVVRLLEALDVPLRDRNNFLNAAGYANFYRHSNLDDSELEPALNALRFILERHEPYPAFVVDRQWNLILANEASRNLIAAFRLPADLDPAITTNLVRLSMHPDGIRPYVENWEAIVEAIVLRARREAAVAYGDDPLKELLHEILQYPDVANVVRGIDAAEQPTPVVPLELRIDGRRLSWFSIITTFGTPQDVTLQEIRLETFAPSNQATADFAESLASA